MRKITLSQQVRYFFDKIMARGTVALIGALAILSVILIVVISAIVALVGVAPDADGQTLSFGKVA